MSDNKQWSGMVEAKGKKNSIKFQNFFGALSRFHVQQVEKLTKNWIKLNEENALKV